MSTMSAIAAFSDSEEGLNHEIEDSDSRSAIPSTIAFSSKEIEQKFHHSKTLTRHLNNQDHLEAISNTHDAGQQNEKICFICMAADERQMIELPCSRKCNSTLVHATCIFEWKQRGIAKDLLKGSCPLCRSPLSEFTYHPSNELPVDLLRTFSMRQAFVFRPVMKQLGMIRCYIRVIHKAVFQSPRFEFYLQAYSPLPYELGVLPSESGPRPDDQVLLMARKRIGFLRSRLEITLDESDSDYNVTSPYYGGVIDGNFTGLKYSLAVPASSASKESVEICCVQYEPNRFGASFGPRKLRVVIPRVNSPSTNCSLKDEVSSCESYYVQSEDSLFSGLQVGSLMSTLIDTNSNELARMNHIHLGENVDPVWHSTIEAYSLDFRGRVTLPSNKNFQLHFSDCKRQKSIALQFGKVHADETGSEEVYTLDFQHPLSPIQAFGIALSAYDRKLFCA